MQKIRKVLVGIIATVLLTNSTTSVFAAETNEMNATILSIEENNLRQFAIDNEENIVLLDEDDYVLNEFHSDGYVAEFIYAEGYSAEHTRQLISIADNDDTIQNISYDEEGNIDEIDIYVDEEYMGTKKIVSQTSSDEDVMPFASYSTFYVSHSNGTKVNMSNLIGDSNFVRQNTSASQKDIQSLFDTTGSPLRNNITIYKKNSKGSVYNTGVSVTPAKIIYDTSVTYSISPKVILATLQKESSLVSSYHASDSLSSKCFYFCMDAGSNSSTTTTGFDEQIKLGTSTLQKWYQDGVDNYTFPYCYSNTGFRGYRGYGSTGYSTDIWCDNAATYSLYKYTPYTCASNESTHSANVLFLEIYNGKMLSNFPL